jgi:hypothetical protein
VILSDGSVFSGLRASFVRRWPLKPFNRFAPFKPFKPTSALSVQSSNTRYPAVLNRFWILDSARITAFPFFRSSSSQQNSDCQLQLLPTTVHLAPTTHPGEGSLPIGDELQALSNHVLARVFDQKMNVIRSDHIIEHAKTEMLLRLEQPVQVAAPIAAKTLL